MRFHTRDLMVTVDPGVELTLAGPVPPGCGCTQTAQAPACPFPSFADLVTDRTGRLRAGMLEQLRYQLRAELTTPG